MLALRKTTPAFGVTPEEVAPAHPPGPGEVVIDVAAAGICGSDVHAYEWTDGYGWMAPHLPLTLGHEFAGAVVRTGTGSGFREGDRVCVIPFVACGHCAACRAENPRACTAREGIGLTRDGGFAASVRVPARCCVRLPEAMDDELGALIEPLGVGLEAVDTAGVRVGDTVLVLGPGTIGQAIALFARLAGAARVVLAGRDDAPRFAVLRALGFDALVDVAAAPLPGPFDVVIEATGVPGSINDGLAVLRPGGVCVAVGIHAAKLTLDLTALVRNRQQLRGSHGAARDVWDRVIAQVAAAPEAFRPMITHRLALADGVAGFELALRREAGKVVLRP